MTEGKNYLRKVITDLRICGTLLIVGGSIHAGIESVFIGGPTAATGAALWAGAAWTKRTAKSNEDKRPKATNGVKTEPAATWAEAAALRKDLEDLLQERNLNRMEMPKEARDNLRHARQQLEKTRNEGQSADKEGT